MFKKVKGFVKKSCAVVGGVIGSAGVAMATPTITVPAIDTTVMTDAGTAAFTAVALFVAVALGLRMFKKA